MASQYYSIVDNSILHNNRNPTHIITTLRIDKRHMAFELRVRVCLQQNTTYLQIIRSFGLSEEIKTSLRVQIDKKYSTESFKTMIFNCHVGTHVHVTRKRYENIRSRPESDTEHIKIQRPLPNHCLASGLKMFIIITGTSVEMQ